MDTGARTRFYPLLYGLRGTHGADISIQISALTGVWTSDSPARNRKTTAHP